MSAERGKPREEVWWRRPAYEVHRICHLIMPWRDHDDGFMADKNKIGTAFFVSRSGLFLTAAHLVDLPQGRSWCRDPGLGEWIIDASAKRTVRVGVEWVAVHPKADIAAGKVTFRHPSIAAHVWPLAMSDRELIVGERVSAAGVAYTRTEQCSIADSDGYELQVHVVADMQPATVVEYCPNGVGLARGKAYHLDSVFLRGGISGGPVFSATVPAVRAICSSGTATYGTATRIGEALDWRIPVIGRTLRELAFLERATDVRVIG